MEGQRELSERAVAGARYVEVDRDAADHVSVALVDTDRGVGTQPWTAAWRAVDAFHSASPDPVSVGAHVAVAFLALLVVAPPIVAAVAAVWVVMALHVTGAFADRDPCVSRGFLWFAPFTLLPASVVGLGLAAGAAADIRFGAVGGAVAAVAVAASLVLARGVSWVSLADARSRGLAMRRTLIVGAGGRLDTVADRLEQNPSAGLAPVATLRVDGDDVPGWTGVMIQRAIAAARAEHVVLVGTGDDDESLVLAAAAAMGDQQPLMASIVPTALTAHRLGVRAGEVGGSVLLPLGRVGAHTVRQPGKRAFDLVAATLIAVVVLPVIVVTAAVVKLSDGGPVLFRQPRVGRGGRMFEIYKFRTMVVGADQMQLDLTDHNATDGLLFKVHGDPRVTRFGALLRRLGIDELPQLLNVIRGDMSLVGPRPLAVDPDDFDPVAARRHRVMPGITGFWQVAGGNGLAYGDMVELDLAYAESWSLWLDMRLLMRTIPVLLDRGHAPY